MQRINLLPKMGLITKNRSINFILLIFIFLVVAFFFTSEGYFYSLIKGEPIHFFNKLTWQLYRWGLWALFSFFILWLAQKFPIDQNNWYRSVPVHMLGSIFLHLLITTIYYYKFVFSYFTGSEQGSKLLLTLIKPLYSNIIIYWIIFGIIISLDYYRKYRDRELKAARLQTQLTQAQLAALKMQLHPHFLFNTLHAISALIHKDPDTADQMICRLSDLFRLTLEKSDLQEAPLKEELEFLKLYLAIEKTRFGDRLEVIQNIEPETLDAAVPNLILQPLVENAIQYGIAPLLGKGKIEIHSKRKNGSIVIEIRDNGIGTGNNDKTQPDERLGIVNTKKRLSQLYGENHCFSLQTGKEGGTRVIIEIPYRKLNLNETDEVK